MVTTVLCKTAGATLLVYALLGCAAAPEISEDALPTVEGCHLMEYSKSQAAGYITRTSWTGPCQNGLADGVGFLEILTQNGKKLSYRGEMSYGRFSGKGDYVREDGWRFQGTFIGRDFVFGKISNPAGQLRYEGSIADSSVFPYKTDRAGNKVTRSDLRFDFGTLYVGDGARIVDAQFDLTVGMAIPYSSGDAFLGRGISYGKVERDGVVIQRFAGGKSHPDENSYWAAVAPIMERQLAQTQAAAKRDQEVHDRGEVANRRAMEAFEVEQARRKEQDRREAAQVLAGAAARLGGGGGTTSSAPTYQPPPLQSSTIIGTRPDSDCNADIMRIHRDAASRTSSASSRSELLRIQHEYQAVPQRDLFRGPCANHPQAKAYIAAADRLTASYQQDAPNERIAPLSPPTTAARSVSPVVASGEPSMSSREVFVGPVTSNCITFKNQNRSDSGLQWFSFTNGCAATVKVFYSDNPNGTFGSMMTLRGGASDRSWHSTSGPYAVSNVKYIACREKEGDNDVYLDKKTNQCYYRRRP